MTAPQRAEWDTVWMGVEDTAVADGWYPVEPVLRYNELSVFEKKVTFGNITKDSDDVISSWITADLSGGGQVDLLTGADQSRYRHAIADTRKPFAITLPQYVQEITPSGTGTTYPALQVGDTPYVIRGTEIFPWDEDTDAFGTEENTVTTAPTGKGVRFNDEVYMPCGTNGYFVIGESAPGNPTVTYSSGHDAVPSAEAATDSPQAEAFAVWDGRLWAVTASGALAWSFSGDNNNWSWIWQPDFGRGTQILDGTATQLIPFFDHEGSPTLYVVADNGTAWMFDQAEPALKPTTIQFAAHPDFGRTATVWRPGEDLLIAVGLGLIKYTVAGVKDPEMGLSRGDGMPYTNLGAIVDLEPETSALYALVSGTTTTTTAFVYDSQWNSGTSSIGQIARDSSGNLYLADFGNDKVQKYTSAGVFDSDIITSVDEVTGVCLDTSNNIYVNYRVSLGEYRVRKYNSAGALQWTTSTGPTGRGHLATDDTHVYVANPGGETVLKFLCIDGSAIATLGSSGTGDGQFADPYGIAYSAVTGNLYVVDQGNDRVQEITTSGTFVRKWGSSGTGDGQFTTAVAAAVNPQNGAIYVTDSGRDDVQIFATSGSYLSTFGSTGTGNGQFTVPTGIVISADGLSAWVADDASTERVQKFTTTSTAASVDAKPTVMYWTGTGWHGAWELDDSSKQLTWANVTSTSHSVDGYRLWWGCTDGNVYTMPLRRTFHNPRSGWQAGVDRFAASGYALTSRFDALMTGFYKKASRLVLFVDNATPTERIRVRYRIDYPNSDEVGDTSQDSAGWTDFSADGSATYITSPGRHILEFGLDSSSFSWGERFNYIQFRIDLDRGDDEYQTPVLHAMVLNYTKIPQQAKTFQMTVPFPKEEWMGRTGKTIREDLEDLLRADQYVKLVHQEQTYRGQLSAVAGLTATGLDYEGGATVSFIEIPTDN